MAVDLNAHWAALTPEVGDFHWLAELSAPTPGQRPLVVVLDLSDSFPTPNHEIAQLRNLCRRLHRDTPVWIYRLSSSVPLDSGQERLAHLLDGSLDLCQISTDRKLRDLAVSQGSFLRPTMQSISERAETMEVNDLPVILITDGELLDFGEVQIDQRIRAMGLTTHLSPAKLRQWRRVLPKTPLCLLSDRLWDDWLADHTNVAEGRVEVRVLPLLAMEHIVICDLAAREVRPIGVPLLRWNIATQPLLLSGLKRTECPIIINYRFEGSEKTYSCQLGPHSPAIPAETLDAAVELLSQPTSRPAEVAIDISEGDPRFEELWNECTIAAEFAARGQSWIDDQRIARVFRNECLRKTVINDDNRWICDGLICLCLSNPLRKGGARIVLVPLSKHHTPALSWNTAHAPPGIELLHNFRIAFDRMERRWSYSSGLTEIEIAPNSSAQLNAVDCVTNGQRWITMFCGSQ